MRFMTAATVKNLPNYAQEDRLREQARIEQEEKEQQKQERKMVSELGLKLFELTEKHRDTNDTEAFKKDFTDVVSTYKDKMSPEMLQMSMKLSEGYYNQRKQDQEYQHLLDTRSEEKADKTRQKADEGLLAQVYGQPGYSTDYAPDATPEELAGQMSPKTFLNYKAAQDAQKAAEAKGLLDREKHDVEMGLKRAQTAKYAKEAAEEANGTVNPNTPKYRAGLLKHVQDSLKNLGEYASQDEIEKAKAVAATEYHATMQGWEKVTDTQTGQRGYLTQDEQFVDIYGTAINQDGPNTEVNPGTKKTTTIKKGPETDFEKALQITGGKGDIQTNEIIVPVVSDQQRDKVLTDLSKNGIVFDAKQEGNSLVVSIRGLNTEKQDNNSSKPIGSSLRGAGSGILDWAKRANQSLLNLKDHSRENPTFDPLILGK